jgi:hypothetical protein
MPPDSTMVAPRSPVASSRVSNKSTKPLPGVDGRSTWSRRRRDLIASFTAELGRPARQRDKVLIANAASLIVRCEQLHVQIANGATVDDNDPIRLSNAATRVLTALDLDNGRPPRSESLDPLEYARRVSEKREVD